MWEFQCSGITYVGVCRVYVGYNKSVDVNPYFLLDSYRFETVAVWIKARPAIER